MKNLISKILLFAAVLLAKGSTSHYRKERSKYPSGFDDMIIELASRKSFDVFVSEFNNNTASFWVGGNRDKYGGKKYFLILKRDRDNRIETSEVPDHGRVYLKEFTLKYLNLRIMNREEEKKEMEIQEKRDKILEELAEISMDEVGL